MTYKSPKERITDVYHPIARVVKKIGRGIKKVIKDPLGIKREKTIMEMHDREMDEMAKDRKAGLKKEYYKVK